MTLTINLEGRKINCQIKGCTRSANGTEQAMARVGKTWVEIIRFPRTSQWVTEKTALATALVEVD